MLELPDEVLRHTSVEEDVANEKKGFTIVEDIRMKDDGVYVYYKGAEYPMRGLFTPKFMAGANVAKRMFIGGVKILTSWWMAPALLVIALAPWKVKMKIATEILQLYRDISFKVMKDHVMKPEFQSPFEKELEWSVYCFLSELGFTGGICRDLSEVVALIINGDNAYRHRVMDLFYELDKNALRANPKKEVYRILEIVKQREKDTYVYVKFKKVVQLMLYVLYIPKVKKAFNKTLDKVEFDYLTFDKAEQYWALLHKDYDYFGMSYEARIASLNGKKIPEIHYND